MSAAVGSAARTESAVAGRVVVGVDGSGPSHAAIARGAWEARRRGGRLLLVQGRLSGAGSAPGPEGKDDNEQVVAAEELLCETTVWVRDAYPDLIVSAKAVAASGGRALVEESESAALIVVGSRGAGGFPGVTLGSVADQVVTHARCPVVVVRNDPGPAVGPEERSVIVGIDGSHRSRDALAFAFDQAQARGLPLSVVYVWSVPEMASRQAGAIWSRNLTTAAAQMRQAAEDVLIREVTPWYDRFPQVTVRVRAIHGDEPAYVLLDLAEHPGTELVVVAARGQRGIDGMLLGSVSRTLATHSPCSVAVTHPRNPADGSPTVRISRDTPTALAGRLGT